MGKVIEFRKKKKPLKKLGSFVSSTAFLVFILIGHLITLLALLMLVKGLQ